MFKLLEKYKIQQLEAEINSLPDGMQKACAEFELRMIRGDKGEHGQDYKKDNV